MTHQRQISFPTTGHGHMHDLTEQVTTIAAGSGIRTGLIHVFTIGSTSAIGTIEFEPGLERDLSTSSCRPACTTDKPGTTATATPTFKPRCSAPRSPFLLGTWQQIFHLECDVRARQRKAVVTVSGGVTCSFFLGFCSCRKIPQIHFRDVSQCRELIQALALREI
jgi:thiamine phosphate synthase YjbQ (UPF0047 family)